MLNNYILDFIDICSEDVHISFYLVPSEIFYRLYVVYFLNKL